MSTLNHKLHWKYRDRTADNLEVDTGMVQAVIVPCSTICNVPRRGGVVEFVGVNHSVCKRSIALVKMSVAGENKVDVVLEKKWFKHVFAFPANVRGVILIRNVPWTVASNDNPGSFRAVHRSQISLQPCRPGIMIGLKGPASNPSDPPGSSGATKPWPRSVSVSNWT